MTSENRDPEAEAEHQGLLTQMFTPRQLHEEHLPPAARDATPSFDGGVRETPPIVESHEQFLAKILDLVPRRGSPW